MPGITWRLTGVPLPARSVTFVDTVLETDKSMTMEELKKHLKTLPYAESQIIDSWGVAYFRFGFTLQTKYKFVKPDCCCVWVSLVDIQLIRKMYIAKDVPDDERERTEWHEKQHFEAQKEVFDSDEFRDAVNSAAAHGKNDPKCKRIQPEQACDKWRQDLNEQWQKAIQDAVDDAVKEMHERADDFHENEDDLWKQHQKGK